MRQSQKQPMGYFCQKIFIFTKKVLILPKRLFFQERLFYDIYRTPTKFPEEQLKLQDKQTKIVKDFLIVEEGQNIIRTCQIFQR